MIFEQGNRTADQIDDAEIQAAFVQHCRAYSGRPSRGGAAVVGAVQAAFPGVDRHRILEIGRQAAHQMLEQHS